jgi:hypothetical protein
MAVMMYPTEGFDIPPPTSLSELRTLVGGYPEFLRFSDGSVFVKSEHTDAGDPVNVTACHIAVLKGFGAEEIRGRVVFLTATEAAVILPVTASTGCG